MKRFITPEQEVVKIETGDILATIYSLEKTETSSIGEGTDTDATNQLLNGNNSNSSSSN